MSCKHKYKSNKILYNKIKDWRLNTKGEWSLIKCNRCDLIFLHPKPTKQSFQEIYPNNYYTHIREKAKEISKIKKYILYKIINAIIAQYGYKNSNENFIEISNKKLNGFNINNNYLYYIAGKILKIIPLLEDLIVRKIMFIKGPAKGIHLDIGCGNGWLLDRTRNLGWNVLGIEPDPKAANQAKKINIDIVGNKIENANIKESSITIITIRHVIEHVEDPSSLLKQCFKLLKPHGKLIIITPNIESLGYKKFKKYWRDIDSPRHLYLFSIKTLKNILIENNFSIKKLRTSSPSAYKMFIISNNIKRFKKYSIDCNIFIKIKSFFFTIKEELLRLFIKNAGEELLAIAVKNEKSK